VYIYHKLLKFNMNKIEDDEYLILLGEKIDKLRKKKKINKVAFAKATHMSRTQLERVIKGEVNSTINSLRKISVQLEIPIEKLVKIIKK
jgi:transcriptional regulator with XRE-family HTH domain